MINFFLITLFLAGAGRGVAFVHSSFVPSTSSIFHPSRTHRVTKAVQNTCECDGLVMFQDDSSSSRKTRDTIENKVCSTKLGNLSVPSVGIGTISWSSQSLTTLENLELQSVVNEACNLDAAFFDTAERYGSHIKTALGLGYGETELLLQKLIGRSTGGQKVPIVATKFTPTPWRTTVDSVVEACDQSRRRLGVDQIDLYQLHMPDIVQPFSFLGLKKSKDEVYWQGLAECYRLGLVKNVGVSNYGPTLVR